MNAVLLSNSAKAESRLDRGGRLSKVARTVRTADEMKAKLGPLAIILVVVALVFYECGPGYTIQSFNKAMWNAGRQINPDLNISPWMLDDLMSNHLTLGMSLAAVTNLLGNAEIRTQPGNGVRVRGEFLEQTVYVYRPGRHNGWQVQGTNSLVLYFGRNGEYLREWSPVFPVVKPVSAVESEATRTATPDFGLHIGNLRFAGTPGQFDRLLGPPDEKGTEYQLDYFLGKRSRFAWDEVFLELHFDAHQKLSRKTWSEH